MRKSAQPVGELVVLGQSRVWPTIALPGVVVILVAVVGVLLDYVVWSAVLFGLASIIIAVTRRQGAVFADDFGLLVRDRGGLRRSYAWDEIERMGWADAGMMWGSSVAVYPRGGPYDVPGPNASVNVGHIWGSGRRRSADPIPELLKAHGIKGLFDK
ncbi:hypothetical protein OG400_30020 [Micromonospora ureilytica]|uniref:hypothetical protein n=1 Tax=Micromonospora ureilytica TaxID=709868 RepID=UPI002E0FF26A|nr:hypothetical protein OG400_30020 [Micromonospora ureilytica]